LIAKIDEIGGAVRAIEEGFMQRAIGDSSYEYQKQVEAGEQVIVGLNKFQIEEQLNYKILKVSQDVERQGVEKIQALRQKRNQSRADETLQAVVSRAKDGNNLMPAILEAVRAECTTGEIADALREVFGTYQEN